ncbi:MAG: hypothetical protein AAGM36_03335 [Cyanobacteria bacterium J06597_1]
MRLSECDWQNLPAQPIKLSLAGDGSGRGDESSVTVTDPLADAARLKTGVLLDLCGGREGQLFSVVLPNFYQSVRDAWQD